MFSWEWTKNTHNVRIFEWNKSSSLSPLHLTQMKMSWDDWIASILPKDRKRFQKIFLNYTKSKTFTLEIKFHTSVLSKGNYEEVYLLGLDVLTNKITGNVRIAKAFLLRFNAYRFLEKEIKQLKSNFNRNNTNGIKARNQALNIYTSKSLDLTEFLPNREVFKTYLRHISKREDRETLQKRAILYIDINNFRIINSVLGRKDGDIVLNILFLRLIKRLKRASLIAYMGQDEFAVLLRNIKKEEEIQKIARLIYRCLSQPIVQQNREFTMSCSIGVVSSLYLEKRENIGLFLDKSEIAMYKAKDDLNLLYTHFDEKTYSENSRSLELNTIIQKFFANNDFCLNFQPIVETKTRKIIDCEALLRHRDPNFSFTITEVILQMENIGMIQEIGLWIFEKACQFASILEKNNYGHIEVGINVSPLQFKSLVFADDIKKIIDKVKINSSQLQIEITESSLIDLNTSLSKTIHTIKGEYGIEIVLDDFGTGYTSFDYLHQIPISKFKVDQALISNIHNKYQRAIFKSIMVLGHSLDMVVIAEGVEQQEQFDFLNMIGCDQIQGNYFSVAVPADEFLSLLEKGNLF